VSHLVTYVMPIRSAAPVDEELFEYLQGLISMTAVAEVIVVDGSDAPVFADFESRRPFGVHHLCVDPDFQPLANGKVAGVLTGLRHASQPYVVVADDDVRYDQAGLEAVQRSLDRSDIVRPQNYFWPVPWHARLDTARTLINRVTGGDWPGTFGLRRALLARTNGYDGDVLFENLELVRTVKAAGGREHRPLNLFVRRLPPRTRHFWSQRVRQAYDEFARPVRLLTWLAVLPVLILVVTRYGGPAVGAASVIPMLLAEAGRRIGDGTRVFPVSAALMAPFWILERAVCVWIAVAARVVVGGIHYHGRVVSKSATPYRTLIARHRHSRIRGLQV